MSSQLRQVAIVGGGVAAAMAALALARRIPRLSLTWIDTGVPQESIEDVLGLARPSLGHFHRALGIDDADLLRRTHCGQRRGTLVEGWGAETFFRGHDRLPAGLPGVPPHQLWLRLPEGLRNRPAWIDLAGCAMAHTDAVADAPPPALLLDLDEYRDVLGQLTKSTGIRRIAVSSVDIGMDPHRQRIGMIRLPDGEAIPADLFIDATGPQRLLHSQLPGGWIDWQDQLPTRTLRIEHLPPVVQPLAYDRLIAEENGWRIEACLPRATLSVTGWGDDGIARDSDEPAPALRLALRPGRLDTPFHANVVALGSAAVILDPIGATALHLLCRQIERLIAYWPGQDLDPAEIALYNRRSALDADRMRDFAQLHFLASARHTPFWQSVRAARSAQLASDLSLFEARGRLLPADEDGFETDEWIATLLGLGLRPAQRDALADAVPVACAREWIATAAARADTHQ